MTEPRHLTLADLERDDCRFPFGTDRLAYTFCGAPKAPGSSYCEEHLRFTSTLGLYRWSEETI